MTFRQRFKAALFSLWGRASLPGALRWRLVSLFVPKFAVGVVGVLLNERDEILLFHHTYRGSRFAWGLPSGWLDPGEDPARCIVREIGEETGLEVRVRRPLLVENAATVRRVDLIFWVEWVGGAFRPSSEVDAMRFFPQDALPVLLPNQVQVIVRVFEALRQERAQRAS